MAPKKSVTGTKASPLRGPNLRKQASPNRPNVLRKAPKKSTSRASASGTPSPETEEPTTAAPRTLAKTGGTAGGLFASGTLALGKKKMLSKPKTTAKKPKDAVLAKKSLSQMESIGRTLSLKSSKFVRHGTSKSREFSEVPRQLTAEQRQQSSPKLDTVEEETPLAATDEDSLELKEQLKQQTELEGLRIDEEEQREAEKAQREAEKAQREAEKAQREAEKVERQRLEAERQSEYEKPLPKFYPVYVEPEVERLVFSPDSVGPVFHPSQSEPFCPPSEFLDIRNRDLQKQEQQRKLLVERYESDMAMLPKQILDLQEQVRALRERQAEIEARPVYPDLCCWGRRVGRKFEISS